MLDYDQTKTEVPRSSLCAFVSDGIHSYGATYNRTHLDSGPLQWYNLVTGEFLGVFPVEDACIDDDGNLLTIYGQTASYAAPLTNPDIKYDCYIFYPSGKRKKSFSLIAAIAIVAISMSSCEQEREDVRNVLGNHPKFLTVTEAF